MKIKLGHYHNIYSKYHFADDDLPKKKKARTNKWVMIVVK
jgi:hypothetical protein